MRYPKFPYFRSQTHLRNVASLACQWCGLDDGCQAAHSNHAHHGKGRGIKASDEYTAALCQICHHMVDQSKLSRQERDDIWQTAHMRTYKKLKGLGLWPLDIDPYLEENDEAVAFLGVKNSHLFG